MQTQTQNTHPPQRKRPDERKEQQETNNNFECLENIQQIENENRETWDYNKNRKMFVLEKRIRLLRDDAMK